MKKVVYRDIEKKDYGQIRELICSAFQLDSYVSNEKTLELVAKQYLCGCLAEQTYGKVAQVDGKIVGVIMGASDNGKHSLGTVKNTLLCGFYILKIMLFHKKECNSQGDIHKAYGELIKNQKNKYDGVLTLFIVDDDFQGLGIGKNLLKEVQNYWKENGTSKSYLYTDDTCNYGFYEHMGFERVNKRDIDVYRNGEKGTLEVYLYEYSS